MPQMSPKPLHPWLRALLEFGPVVGFVLTYLVFRDDVVEIAGTRYSGFVAVTAGFLPVFIAATGLLWWLSGRIARVQLATAAMVVLVGVLGVWFNDPRLLMMKPTVIYLVLALMLAIGLLRGQGWLRVIMEEMIPLRPEGWRVLSLRTMVLFVLSAAANELVWRTRSETFWVLFETFVMPLVIVGFFLSQIRLYVEYASWKPDVRGSSK